jgi:hypothetical protein
VNLRLLLFDFERLTEDNEGKEVEIFAPKKGGAAALGAPLHW